MALRFVYGGCGLAILIGNVPWFGGKDERIVARHLGVDVTEIDSLRLLKSLDARHKKQSWRAVYRLEVRHEDAVLRKNPSAGRWTSRDSEYALHDGAPECRSDWPDGFRPIVVGAGPAGLFAALFLAEAGAPVVLLERGQPVEGRVGAVNGYWRGKLDLDVENNLLFGEGGAGTFSDGKIYTRRRDGGWALSLNASLILVLTQRCWPMLSRISAPIKSERCYPFFGLVSLSLVWTYVLVLV